MNDEAIKKAEAECARAYAAYLRAGVTWDKAIMELDRAKAAAAVTT